MLVRNNNKTLAGPVLSGLYCLKDNFVYGNGQVRGPLADILWTCPLRSPHCASDLTVCYGRSV